MTVSAVKGKSGQVTADTGAPHANSKWRQTGCVFSLRRVEGNTDQWKHQFQSCGLTLHYTAMTQLVIQLLYIFTFFFLQPANLYDFIFCCRAANIRGWLMIEGRLQHKVPHTRIYSQVQSESLQDDSAACTGIRAGSLCVCVWGGGGLNSVSCLWEEKFWKDLILEEEKNPWEFQVNGESVKHQRLRNKTLCLCSTETKSCSWTRGQMNVCPCNDWVQGRTIF